MILAADVHYETHAVRTACVGFVSWSDASAARELVELSEAAPAPYEPGQFYKRELPYLLRIVDAARRSARIETVIIDGHVWLNENQPGLGAHLYRALGEQVAVVGVGKTAFRGGVAVPVLRGLSRAPLYVSAAGIVASHAAELVRGMHGPHRIPTLLKRADRLARGYVDPSPPEE